MVMGILLWKQMFENRKIMNTRRENDEQMPNCMRARQFSIGLEEKHADQIQQASNLQLWHCCELMPAENDYCCRANRYYHIENSLKALVLLVEHLKEKSHKLRDKLSFQCTIPVGKWFQKQPTPKWPTSRHKQYRDVMCDPNSAKESMSQQWKHKSSLCPSDEGYLWASDPYCSRTHNEKPSIRGKEAPTLSRRWEPPSLDLGYSIWTEVGKRHRLPVRSKIRGW